MNDEAYAFEELVAEFGAAYLFAHFGFKYKTQHAAYIKSWARQFDDKPQLILSAANKAQKAADFVLLDSKNEVDLLSSICDT